MILRSEGLVKKYKRRTVVNEVSVQVEQGEIVGLLGPNGARQDHQFLYDRRGSSRLMQEKSIWTTTHHQTAHVQTGSAGSGLSAAGKPVYSGR